MSARRAGLTPYVVDLFADRDTRAIAAGWAKCPADEYPSALPRLARQFPLGPVVYTGGLENTRPSWPN